MNSSKNESPRGKETTTTDYFASSGKPKVKKSSPSETKVKSEAPSPMAKAKKVPARFKKDMAANSEANGRRLSQRKGAKKSYGELNDSDEDAFLDDDAGAVDDIFAADAKKCGRRKDDGYVESDSEEDLVQIVKRSNARGNQESTKNEDVDMNDIDNSNIIPDDDETMITSNPTRGRSVSTAGRKRKSPDLEDEDEEVDTPKKGRKAKNGTKKPPAKKPRAKKEDPPENAEIQAIFDSIPTVRAPTPPPRDAENKFDWRAAGPGNSGPPPAAGAKEIPTGAEDCLAGLTFVFTGLLETISREAGQELVKRHGGRVTGTPSSKTSYVVLGSDAGPSKLEKIKAMNIKTVSEDGLFELIRRLPAGGGGGKASEKSMEKKKAEEERVKREAAEMEREEKRLAEEAQKAEKNAAAARGIPSVAAVTSMPLSSSQLWTTKYAPTKTNQICGNKGQVEKIQKWLEKWPYNRKHNFMLPGADGSGKYRAIIIHGPPGIGKTTAAHLAAKLEGYDVIESNASDTRSKKLVESGLSEVLNNSSLLGFFAGDGKEVDKQKKKIVLIMDEVDGMSAGDRGGVGALAKVCKKTEVPMILICNERRIPKMKPFDHVAYDIMFKRPTVEQVRSRIATICAREGLKIPAQVMDALIEGSNKDIRQIINMLSTAKLDQTSMDFDQGKSMSKAWEKHIVLKPWDICNKLLGGGMFALSSKATLNDKIELYFNDHELSFLMIQENYLSTRPMLATNQGLSTKEQQLKTLELADKAAESISDGDLVDRMIHGSQQQWSLMPTHAVFSTVRPASFMSGSLSGNTGFPTWLGNNSKQGKMVRYVREIQAHMRLRTSGDRHEIRQQYLPVLWERLIKRLELEGKDCIEDVIELMDSYFLTKDDFDYITELGLGPQNQNGVKIETATKSTFTRL
jgi:replication factor C subunit 1